MGTSDSTTDETSSRFLKDFFTTDHSKAFLQTYGTNYRNFDKIFFSTTKNTRNSPSTSRTDPIAEESDENVPPHNDIYFPSPNQKKQTRPEWYGTQLAKQQAYQEQRVFANRQHVRFVLCGGCFGDSSNDHVDDDYDEAEDDDENDNNDDEAEDSKNHEDADTKQPWQSSQLAKTFRPKSKSRSRLWREDLREQKKK